MPVIITDMSMPKRCLDCQLMGREKMYCQLHPRKDLNVIRVVSEKPDWCTLKEVPTGKWIEHEPFERNNCNKCIECSVCKVWLGNDCYAKTNFCPMCGSRMVEEQQGEDT